MVEDTFDSELSAANPPDPSDVEDDGPGTDEDLQTDEEVENADGDAGEDVEMHDVSDERGLEDVAGLFTPAKE